eukprot:UN05185
MHMGGMGNFTNYHAQMYPMCFITKFYRFVIKTLYHRCLVFDGFPWNHRYIKHLQPTCKNSKILFMIRDPISAVYSFYKMLVRIKINMDIAKIDDFTKTYLDTFPEVHKMTF